MAGVRNENSVFGKMRSVLTEYLKDVPVGHAVYSSDLLHKLKVNGFDGKRHLGYVMKQLGFKVDRAGSASKYYRIYTPNGYKPEADENGHVPTLAERLNAQVAEGERKEPNMYYNSTEETKPVGLNEVRDKLGIPQVDIGDAVGWAPSPQPSKPKYQFQEVLVSKKLKGKYGEYTVLSDGQVIAELLVSGTMVNECFAELVDELNAVREEMEAI